MAPAIPDQYTSWPVLMTKSKAAKLLGVDRGTLDRNKVLLAKCTITVGKKPKIVRDRLLRELKIIK